MVAWNTDGKTVDVLFSSLPVVLKFKKKESDRTCKIEKSYQILKNLAHIDGVPKTELVEWGDVSFLLQERAFGDTMKRYGGNSYDKRLYQQWKDKFIAECRRAGYIVADLHTDNVIYDRATGRFMAIDVERFLYDETKKE